MKFINVKSLWFISSFISQIAIYFAIKDGICERDIESLCNMKNWRIKYIRKSVRNKRRVTVLIKNWKHRNRALLLLSLQKVKNGILYDFMSCMFIWADSIRFFSSSPFIFFCYSALFSFFYYKCSTRKDWIIKHNSTKGCQDVFLVVAAPAGDISSLLTSLESLSVIKCHMKWEEEWKVEIT